jgi:ferredoxin-thioredoxin reductase catalytic subunit
LEWFKQVAQKYNMLIDDNSADCVLKGLEFNKIEYGKRYCPCKVKRIKDNICPCKDMREKQECYCGLYVKDIKGDN